ncbi:uncharacterized protein BYT42DRAFT_609180 [Radiomyces spectabilis]|uniref:uncharacterized protein n=1 Tax=Radiomyces spectabilis TaxID=64574 RepID=UPI00221F335B|nr:uncharacterized protein BYT42DRAFT_609180 [Radiomyces spectabilis]KAI8393384.1 hypothetical protein BYT42DRAFT_609180 [Radiomyces spectabilis]
MTDNLFHSTTDVAGSPNGRGSSPLNRPFHRNPESLPLLRLFANAPNASSSSATTDMAHSAPLNFMSSSQHPSSTATPSHPSLSPSPVIDFTASATSQLATSTMKPLRTATSSQQIDYSPTVKAHSNLNPSMTSIPQPANHSPLLFPISPQMNREDASTNLSAPQDTIRPVSPLTLKPTYSETIGTPSSEVSNTSSEILSSSGKLVPGAHIRSHAPLGSPSTAKLSPSNRSASSDTGLEGRPMSRARSHSDQRMVLDQNRSGSSHAHAVHGHHPSFAEAIPNATSNLKGHVNTSSPLARRVRSAISLRHSEEDSMPLKTLVANKQQQIYQASKHAQQPVKMSKQSSMTPDGKQTPQTYESHRRSISADHVDESRKHGMGSALESATSTLETAASAGSMETKQSHKGKPNEKYTAESRTGSSKGGSPVPMSLTPGLTGRAVEDVPVVRPLQLDGLGTDESVQQELVQSLNELHSWLDALEIAFSRLK